MQKQVESYSHSESKRKNIPTEQQQSFVSDETQQPVTVEYQRRNPDLDPQLIWKGKYDRGDILSIGAKPLYIQEKIHPKAIIENLRKTSMEATEAPSLFENSFGIFSEADRMDFYKHDQDWTNRMILGDSLQVMASLAAREGLRGSVQCAYVDPPYGIKFNSNFQWSTNTRDIKDGKAESMTREPEMVKAFRDTWKNGVNSYLSYLEDRLIVIRELLSDSGSVFIQISDENIHRVMVLMDEIFGNQNFVSLISFSKNSGFGANLLPSENDFLIWYAKDITQIKYHKLYLPKSDANTESYKKFLQNDGVLRSATPEEIQRGVGNPNGHLVASDNLTKPGPGSRYEVEFCGKKYTPGQRWWGYTKEGLNRAIKANRVMQSGKGLRYIRKLEDFSMQSLTNVWTDTRLGGEKTYVVQTAQSVIQRCILMTTDPSDLVLDPTCGSGTTAFVAEQWGRRWITIDTSRVALALARARLMGGQFPYYYKKDSQDGLIAEAAKFNKPLSTHQTSGSLSYGFVYDRVPYITLKDIANNEQIDIIYDKYEPELDSIRSQINELLGTHYQSWEMPRKFEACSENVQTLIDNWWQLKVQMQNDIDKCISDNAEYKLLYDKPLINKEIIRVSGPFTVESLSPHRILSINADGKSIDPLSSELNGDARDFASMIIENLRTNGIQQSDKSGKLDFISVEEFPGDYLCAEGRYMEGDQERRAGILIGPEFGTLSRSDIMAAAREAVDCGFSLLVASAFHFDAQSSDVTKLGRLPIMKVMMNTDLMMGDALKGKGNLFVAFGEPDIVLENADNDQLRVRVRGVDIFFPSTGEVRSDNEDGIACWFVDTDYDQESFFVRQAYFLGAKNPYEALKKTLKADIDEDTWETLHSNVSRAFPKPKSGYVAVKVINHLGDEAMKVLKI